MCDFNSVEEAKKSIKESREAIQKAEEYIRKNEVTLSDIKPGQFFSGGRNGSPFMIVQTKYTTYPKDRKYAITGLCGDFLQHFSNMQDVTADKILEYVNAQGSKKLDWKLVVQKGNEQ